MTDMKDIDLQINCLEQELEISKLYVNYWLASASNGHSTRRKIYKGGHPDFGGKLLSEGELVDDAMHTAKRHIDNIREISENIISLKKQHKVK